MPTQVDIDVEQHASRAHGMLGRGGGMANPLYAMDYGHLPIEAIRTFELILRAGPFPHPQHDGKIFKNKFHDLPEYSGDYLEFTVRTPGVASRGARRLVARRSGVLFFTACHYERVQGQMSYPQRQAATALVDEAWRNGFYVVTGMTTELRSQLRVALAAL